MPPRITQSSVQPRGSAHVPLASLERTPPSASVTVCLPCLTHGSSPSLAGTPPLDMPPLTTLITTTRSFPPSIHGSQPCCHGSRVCYLPKTNTPHDEKAQDHVSHQLPRPRARPRSALGRKLLSEYLSKTQSAPGSEK